MMPTQKSFSGFTLIELLAVVVIAGILSVLAVPSFQGFLASSQVDSTASNLYSAVLVARNEAILRNTQVNLCASTDFITCNGATWNRGWIVRETAGSGAAIKVWEAAPVAINATAGLASITFNSDSSLNGAASNGFTFTVTQNITRRRIIVNGVGKPRIQ